MEENKSEVKKDEKINFFKKIWYSIGKISKYDEMINLGWKSAIKYFLGLLAILSVILMAAALGVETWMGTNITSNLLYYAAIYFFSYLIVLFLVYALYLLLIAICMFIVLKVFKVKCTFKDMLSLSIYSATLSVIIYVAYLIISYCTGFVISYFDSIALFVVFIYIYLNLRRKRGVIRDGFHRKNKKKSTK